MPSPGAQPWEGYDALDLGRTADGRWLIGTRYTDGSYVIWDAATEEEVAYISPGRTDPADLGGGRAAVINPDGSLTAFDIADPPPELQGAPPPQAPGATPANPNAPTGPVGTRQPGQDFNYGPSLGRYSPRFGSGTVSPATRNPADPSQGRSAGWGSIGAGTEGVPFGWGVPGFGKDPIKIDPGNYAGLADAAVTPGYIPGSGTYNQRPLDTPGLFGTVGGKLTNLAFGSGGVGDPTTGREAQTPWRWVTGNPNDPRTSEPNDDAWRARMARGGGLAPQGGGWDQAWAAAAPRYAPPPTASAAPPGGAWQSLPSGVDIRQRGAGGGYDDPSGMGGGNYGPVGGFFGTTVSSNWGDTPETAGLGFIANLFLRSDTPTGIGTPAWSAPAQVWDALLNEIRTGRVYVRDPQAWQMLSERLGRPVTPQTIGGAALGGQNVAPGGTGSTTEDAIANGNAAEAADRAAYWAYQQSLLRQGDQRIALEEARDAWAKAYQTAGLTGQFGGQDTMAMQQQRFAQGVAEAGLTGQYGGAPTVQEQQRLYEQGVTNAGLLGTYQGQDTLAKIAQQNQAALALLGLQSNLQGPRNWARYQSTFGATPQGLQDVLGAFQGRYQLPTGMGAQSTAQGGRQSVSGLAGDILSGTYGNGGQPQAEPQQMFNPRQVDLQNWSRAAPSQREVVLGQFEDAGWYGDDVLKLMQGAAPRNPGASSANYNFLAR